MTASTIADAATTERVHELRTAGLSPKEIARKLGLRPATVTALIRDLAVTDAAQRTEPALAGCWVSPGWSVGLSFDGHPDWPDDEAEPGHQGVAVVAVARRARPRRVTIASFLVDTFCLGVKNAIAPRPMSDRDVPAFLDLAMRPFGGASAAISVPLDLAQHLVLGGVDYARSLGFEPHPEFADAAGHLGARQGPSDITFGLDGTPYYVSGPYDDAGRVMRTLSRTAGEGNFHYMVGVGV